MIQQALDCPQFAGIWSHYAQQRWFAGHSHSPWQASPWARSSSPKDVAAMRDPLHDHLKPLFGDRSWTRCDALGLAARLTPWPAPL